MSTGYKIIEQDAAYFVTFQVVYWIDIFTRKQYKALKDSQEHKGLEIFAFVIMSNHVHLLIRSNKNMISSTIGEIKSFTAKTIIQAIETENESRKDWMLNLFKSAANKHKRNRIYQVWTHENHAELIYSDKFILQKINYIHENPVRAGIVENPEDYIYSSARSYSDKNSVLEITDMLLPMNRLPVMRTLR